MADLELAKVCVITDDRIYLPNEIILGDYHLHPVSNLEDEWCLSPYLFVRPGDWPVIEEYLSRHPVGDKIQARIFYIALYQYVTTQIRHAKGDLLRKTLREVPTEPATFIKLIEDFRVAVSLRESLLISLHPRFEKTLSAYELRCQIIQVVINLFEPDELKAHYIEVKAALVTTVRAHYNRTTAGQMQAPTKDQEAMFRVHVDRQLAPLRDADWLEEPEPGWTILRKVLLGLDSKQKSNFVMAKAVKAVKAQDRRETKLAMRVQAAQSHVGGGGAANDVRKKGRPVFERSANPSPPNIKTEPVDADSLTDGTVQVRLHDADMLTLAANLSNQLQLSTVHATGRPPRRIAPTLVFGPKHDKQPTRNLSSYFRGGGKKQTKAQRRAMRKEQRAAEKRAKTESNDTSSGVKIEQ